jgi:hypothetical protein
VKLQDSKTLAMEDDYVHNNPQDMNLIMETLASKLEPFGDDGGYKSNIILKGKSIYQEDSIKDLWK